MTDRDSGNKSFAEKDKAGSSKTQADSITKVHFSNPKLLACYRNRRVVRSFRVDEGLWEAFKPVAKAKWGSICACIEDLTAVVLHHDAEKVYICNTINPVMIDKVVIERNLRPRRKLEIEQSEMSPVVEEPVCGFCGKPLVIARFRHVQSGIEKDACDFHAKALCGRSDWVEVTLRKNDAF